MANSCVFKFDAINELTGERSGDILWDELNSYFGNHSEAKQHYATAVDQNILETAEKAGIELQYNEQGLPTLETVLEINRATIDKDKLKSALEKSQGKGQFMSYSQAIYLVQNYNKNYPNSKLMATFKESQDGLVKLAFVDNNSANKADLIKQVENRCFLDRMMYYLRNMGVDVRFNEQGFDTVYNTINAEKNAQGLLELIKLASSKKDNASVRQDLADVVGQLIVDCMDKNDPLLTRLFNLISKELVSDPQQSDNSLLEQFEIRNPKFDLSRVSNKDRIRVLAGYLVGQVLQEVKSNTKGTDNIRYKKYGSLIDRIITKIADWFKRVVLRRTPNIEKEYKTALQEVKDVAYQIAEGFMSPTFKGNVQNALDEGTSYAKYNSVDASQMSVNVKVSKEVLDRLYKLTKDVRQYNYKFYKRLYKKLADAEGKIQFGELGNIEDSIMDTNALLAIVSSLDALTESYTEMQQQFEKLDFGDLSSFINKAGEYARIINTISLYLETVTSITNYISDYLADTNDTPERQRLKRFTDIPIVTELGTIDYINLRDVNNHLRELVGLQGSLPNTFASMLTAKKREYVLKNLEAIIGTKQVNHATRVLGIRARTVYADESNSTSTVEHMMDYLDEDISWFNRRFASMSNNSDIIGQAYDKILKMAKLQANRKYLMTRDQLLQLDSKVQEMNEEMSKKDSAFKKIKLENLYAKDADGVLTGYLKGYIEDKDLKVGVDWGKWEDDFEEFKQNAKKEFAEKMGRRKLKSMRDAERGIAFAKFFNAKHKAWHKEHSISVKEKNNEGKVIRTTHQPNPKLYKSDAYENLSNEEKNILEEYMVIKRQMDSLIPSGSTQSFRAPQMYGTWLNQVNNRMDLKQNLPKAWLGSLMQNICDSFTKNVNDTDFGSDLTVNDPNDPLYNFNKDMDEKIKRIPLFYINKIDKEKRYKMSTDLIGTTMAYAAMAHQYNNLQQIEGLLATTTSQLKQRKLNTGKIDMGSSNAYQRITTFLDKELYGISFTNNQRVFLPWVIKTIKQTTAWASRLFLGGNIQGAAANTLMGATEVFKEALTGQFFDKHDLAIAHKNYFKNTKDLLLDAFRQIKENEVNMFAEYFDIFGENNRTFRTMNFRNPSLYKYKQLDLFYHNAFAPYSAGDHYMQLIPFLALAEHIKLYYKDDEGKIQETSMYDAYTRRKDRQVINPITQLPESQATSPKGIYGLKDIFTSDPLGLGQHNLVKKASDVDSVLQMKEEAVQIQELITKIRDHIDALKKGKISVFSSKKYQAILDKHNLTVDNNDSGINNTQTIKELSNIREQLRTQIHDKIWTVEDENAFKLKGREIGNRLHGIYNMQDKVEFQQNVLGNSILAMRGYMLGMVERRWGSDKYSLALGQDVEGSEWTAIKTIMKIFNPEDRQRGYTIGKLLTMNFLPTIRSQYAKEIMEQFGFSDFQYYNMRRHWWDWFVIWTTSVLVGGFLRMILGFPGLLGRPKDSDDEDYYPKNENDYIPAVLYYFLSRLYMEQAAYNEIFAFTKVEGPNALSLLGSNIGALSTLLDILTSLIQGDTYKSGKWEGESKAKIKLLKYMPYWRWKYVVGQDPRKAAQSFELNRGAYR